VFIFHPSLPKQKPPARRSVDLLVHLLVSQAPLRAIDSAGIFHVFVMHMPARTRKPEQKAGFFKLRKSF
jgi:hypothetical protein